MKKSRITIPDADRARILLWCARHCCFCGKACTTNIEVHHIDGNPANNDLGNLIPVCFDCHGELERYNPRHPVGTKYRHLEITTRRDQIYELHTRDYLRQIEITISRCIMSHTDEEGKRVERPWGDTSCSVRTLSRDLPLRLRFPGQGNCTPRRIQVVFLTPRQGQRFDRRAAPSFAFSVLACSLSN